MTISHGFELVKEEEIEELGTAARFYRHVQTGAELLSLMNDDENKVFSVVFPTPPADSTGLPHIMEHAVLGGSRKYRAKEPFVELLKGSLKTFVNAFTSADRTMYPVASPNLQDFYNLVDVYLDAVLYPLITPNHLAQEGWHYELEDVDEPLVYRGIVFNEMKGAYSSPEGLLFRYGKETLFPDNAYGFDSGGNPEVMPNLTYEQFKQFHETYYHPSNGKFFFYGDDPEEKRLEILDGYLSGFEAQRVDASVALHVPFAQPQRFVKPYSVDKETADPKSYIQLNWALPELSDHNLIMALSVLSYALVSTQASPLRKILTDSGLGDDLVGGGLSGWGRQMTFGVGMKGVQGENTDKVEALILETLGQLAEEGLEEDMVESALNTIEFRLRENNTGSYPRGIAVMMRAIGWWVYDGEPFEGMKYEEALTAVKQAVATDPTYLQNLIGEYLLQNSHRATLVLQPDPELNGRLERAEREKLAQAKAAMDEAELQAIIEQTRELKRIQETPDSPEVLAEIPRLTLADLERENKTIPIEITEHNEAKILYHDLFTNGIVYLDLGFNLQVLPQELLPYVPLFGSALFGVGTEKESFVKLSQRIGRKTGGVYASNFTTAVRDDPNGAAWFMVRGKATVEQSADLLDILRDVLLTVKLDNQERFKQLVLRAKSGRESSLIPSGHGVVSGRLRSHFNKNDWLSEQMGGVSNLFFLRQLAEDVVSDWPSVLAKLEEIRGLLLNRPGMVCNVTLDGENWTAVQPQIHNFLDDLPVTHVPMVTWTADFPSSSEGLTMPAQVNYVGKGANLYELGYELHGSMFVISNYVRLTHLWDKVRAQGGAYGAFFSFDQQSGTLNQISYRDPNLQGTLDAFDQTAAFLRDLELSEDELVKGIISVIGSIDAPQLPDAKGYTSMVRHLMGITDETRQKRREEVLGTTAADFTALAAVMDKWVANGRVVVLGSPEAVSQQDGLEIIKVM